MVSLDPETTRIILNWVVPGAVTAVITLLGIFFIESIRERNRRKHENQVAIYEPLHKALKHVVSRAERLHKYGYRIEAFPDEFWDLYNRGALHPRHLEDLRQDIETLLRLKGESNEIQGKLWDSREASMKSAWEETTIEDAKGEMQSLSRFSRSSDHAYNEPITAGERERFIERFDKLLESNFELPEDFESPAEDFYRRVRDEIAEVRDEYYEAVEKFLAQAKRITDGLERAMEKGKTYGKA